MNTLTSTTGLAILTLMLSPAAFADPARHDEHRPGHNGHTGHARVVHMEPIVRQVVVRARMRECRLEEVRYPTHAGPRRDVAGPMIVGGIIGAALGHQIGDGHGRDAATLLGALIGSSIARGATHHGTQGSYETVYEERCRGAHPARVEQRIEGYRVTYRQHGELRSTRMSHDPGAHKYRTKD